MRNWRRGKEGRGQKKRGEKEGEEKHRKAPTYGCCSAVSTLMLIPVSAVIIVVATVSIVAVVVVVDAITVVSAVAVVVVIVTVDIDRCIMNNHIVIRVFQTTAKHPKHVTHSLGECPQILKGEQGIIACGTTSLVRSHCLLSLLPLLSSVSLHVPPLSSLLHLHPLPFPSLGHFSQLTSSVACRKLC